MNQKQTKRLPLYVAGVAGISAAAAVIGLTQSSGASGSAVTATPSSTVIKTRDSSFGPILVDGQGRSMYLFAKDNGPASTCQGSCAAAWPPVPVIGTPHVAGGVDAASVAVISRSGAAQRQLTYAGHPLYYFTGDEKAGQTHGQALTEFGAKWYVLNSAGSAVVKAPAASTSGNNYGY